MRENARRGPYRRGVETRRRVVEIAIEVFGRSGYRGGTLQTVADEVGITAGAIVRLFGSKAQLLVAVLEEWDRRQLAMLDAQDTHGLDLLRRTPELLSDNMATRGLLALNIRMGGEAIDPESPVRDRLLARHHKIHDMMTEHLMAASADADIRSLDRHEATQRTRELFAVMDGMQMQWLMEPDMDLIASFERFLTRWLADLAPVGSDTPGLAPPHSSRRRDR